MASLKWNNKMKTSTAFILLIFMCSCTKNNSDISSIRNKTDFNSGWLFALGDHPDAHVSSFSDSEWANVQLPHDWSIEGKIDKDNPSGHFGGFYPGGVGYYRKSFAYNQSWKNKLVHITFDGVFKDSEVWINEHYLGKYPNGYIGFTYDLTPYLMDGNNLLVVRADNSKQPNSRWYTGSGIYRNVWLEVKNKLSVIENGTYVTANEITNESANIHLEVSIGNSTDTDQNMELISDFIDQAGKKKASITTQKQLRANDTLTVHLETQLMNPELWSPETPVQYTVVNQIKVGNEIVDSHQTKFGIRSIRFDTETGFWLNEKNIKIKGVNNHHDGGPVGAAVPDDVLHRRLAVLKEMGCNAIRTAHNTFSPEFYNMCDSMGFLVMDEVFDEWIASWPWVNYKNKGKVEYGYHLLFNEWAAKDLKAVLKHNRNHPSIILWSVGNEIPDQCYPEGPERLKPLLDIVHQMDSTRPVTAGCCFIHLANATGFSDLLDVTGYNGGGGSVFYEKDKAVYPNRKFIATEVPHSFQTRGVYKTKTIMRAPHEGIPVPDLTEEELFPEFSEFYSSSYDNSSVRISARDSWRRTDSLSFMAGEFRWTGIDYLGEAIKGWPSRFWNFGIIDLCGFPKDHYFFYKSQWTTEPMVHILPHWTWPGKEGKIIPVWTYSNCDEVELFLNGKSLGAKSNKGQMNLSWDVPYESGKISAVGKTQGKVVAQAAHQTASVANKIEVLTDKTKLNADGKSCVHFVVNILDSNGNFVPYADNLIQFNVEGPAKIIGVENGDPLDLASTKSNQRKTFNGKCLMILQSTGVSGEITVQVSADNLVSETIKLSAVEVRKMNL